MRNPAKVSLPVILILCLAASGSAAFKTDYFTGAELDMIRDAQELPLRTSTYFKLAQRRLVVLGLLEQTAKEKEKEKKEEELRLKKQAEQTEEKPRVQKPPDDPTAYLKDFTRSDLLRGYSQVVEEVMSNIDEAYSRKLDVRGPLEDLEKFLRDTIPLLEKLEPKNNSERAVVQDAIDKAKEAQMSAKEALLVVPKTEKKRKQ